MDKLTTIKIKYEDETYSDQIPVSVLGENVEWDATHTFDGVQCYDNEAELVKWFRRWE